MTVQESSLVKKVIIPVASVAVIAVAGWIGFSGGDKESLQQNRGETASSKQEEKGTTIGKAWQWDQFKDGSLQSQSDTSDEGEAMDEDAVRFDFAAIHQQLENVRLDDYGNVVVDADALEALNEAFGFGRYRLEGTTLEQLQEIIKTGLPGTAGEQAAKIVGDFNNYLGAKEEFNRISPAPASIDDSIAQYEELQAMRELYLGKEVADKLFVEEEGHALYMMEAMKLELDSDLTQEDKLAMQAQLHEKYLERDPNIDNWDSRFQAYEAEKQSLMNAALSESDKQQQLLRLQEQHFSNEELDQIERANVTLN